MKNKATNKMREFKLYQLNNNKHGKTYLTSVYYDSSFSSEEVKRAIIHHGNFKMDIIVRKYSK